MQFSYLGIFVRIRLFFVSFGLRQVFVSILIVRR